ncbi:MAG: hemolysin family protein [Acidobacteriota bacterium]|nr:hemolysin family protein [Acidobacteriota bacterium]
MSWLSVEVFTLVFLVVVLFLLSVLESAISRISRLSLKVLAERKQSSKVHLLQDIANDRIQFLLPIQFGSQVLLVISAVVISNIFYELDVNYAPIWTFVGMVFVIVLFRQLFPKLIVQSEPERVLLQLLPVLSPLYGLLRWMSMPLIGFLRIFKSSQLKSQMGVDEEAGEEEIQAYLGVGEEEGIIEEDESELIQSALQFSDTLVRGIMTPRNEIVAIEENATITELKDVMVSSKFSRIPVYRERIDHIVGVVYVRSLLAYLGDGNGKDPITPLINKPWFVPEIKKVSALLKEMQLNAMHMAILIDEYTSVSGLVTIEDVLEEIVGEIRDEDELEKINLAYVGEGHYIVHGGAEIGELEEILEIDLGNLDITTVSGLIVDHLGRVPTSGETINLSGLCVEVLSSDQKKIQTMRVKKKVTQ